ncbi:transposase [Aliarcobacter cryaerophilus]|uniref:transposase n=1 Tax=Aliarcobacter cryaerophilus TaxID=28198 RepID=UPI0021B67943|nr:transposase [Aliarcobacter cryaerophilus]MCT7531758.1 transposase [Aliarcobacter cryaerophilus]
MFKNIDYKVFKHSNYNLVFTLIVETLEKKKIISKDIEIELNKVIYNIFENHNKCIVSKIVFVEESILIINFQSTPNIFLSNLISNFKTVSSRLIRKKFNIDEYFWEQKYYLHSNSAF